MGRSTRKKAEAAAPPGASQSSITAAVNAVRAAQKQRKEKAKAKKDKKAKAQGLAPIQRPSRSTKDKNERRKTREDRHAAKMQRRKEEKRAITASMWAAPAPSHLVAALEKPKIKSKYQSYYEFADNPEKKDKKLEFQVTSNTNPPPGYTFIPVGDPVMTSTCKELSRDQEAMVFIVSTQKDNGISKISEHIHRIGYHFRETIVEEAREIAGDAVISKPIAQGFIEPIPETQEEINKQADDAIRDLFPKIPNTDRTMIIEHAFKKGGLFHGEPTVGLQTNIPLSRRVQLAVLAHIRHTHTRYDQLLRETTWMNARKAVEPVCLDFILKWRGDDETGRDQMDEILREVVVITDSESGDDSSDEDEDGDEDEDSSDEDGEVTSLSSSESLSRPNSRNQQRPMESNGIARPQNGVASRTMEEQFASSHIGPPSSNLRSQKDKKAQKGFKRYQAAWDQAVERRQEPASGVGTLHTNFSFPSSAYLQPRINHPPNMTAPTPRSMHDPPAPHHSNAGYQHDTEDSRYYPIPVSRPDSYGRQYIPGTSAHMNETSVRPYSERPIYHDNMPQPSGPYTSSVAEQRPPQVVRGSSTNHNLQDMLVESVETPSVDAFPPSVNGRQGFNHSQDSYPRRVVEHQQPSLPGQPEVIYIDDDSPVPKRRRLVQDDVSGHVRHIQSHDHASYVATPYSNSHLASASFVQSHDSLTRRPKISSQASQGFVRDMRNTYVDSVTGEQLPIYDAPPERRVPTHQYTRRPDSRLAVVPQDVDHNIRQNGDSQSSYANEGLNPIAPRNVYDRDNVIVLDDDQARPVERIHSNSYHSSRPLSPSYALPSQASRSYDMVPTSIGPNSNSVHSIPQSRIHGPLPHTENGYTVISERPRNFASQENRHPYESRNYNNQGNQRPYDSNYDPFAPSSSSQAWSHSGHDQGPLPQVSGNHAPYRGQSQQPLQPHDNIQRPVPVPRDGSWRPWDQAPSYVRNNEPGRVIYLD